MEGILLDATVFGKRICVLKVVYVIHLISHNLNSIQEDVTCLCPAGVFEKANSCHLRTCSQKHPTTDFVQKILRYEDVECEVDRFA